MKSQQPNNRGELWILIGAILVSLAVLIYINIYIFTLVNPKTNISLTFEGESEASVFDGELVFITEYNQEQKSNIFSIFGLNAPLPDQPSISDLVEINSGVRIASDNIKLTPISSPTNITPKDPMRVTFSLTGNTILSSGLYQGTLFIRVGTNIESIPITLDVRPNLAQPVILVVDGIVISIVFWKLITYLNAKYPEVIITDTRELNGRREIREVRQGRQVRYDVMKTDLRKYITDSPIVIKNFILDAGTISFGIALGIIGLSNNEYINSLHNIEPFEVLILIGIGLGIGSLKEFLSKN